MIRRRTIVATVVLAAAAIGITLGWAVTPTPSALHPPTPAPRILEPTRPHAADPRTTGPTVAPSAPDDEDAGASVINAWARALAPLLAPTFDGGRAAQLFEPPRARDEAFDAGRAPMLDSKAVPRATEDAGAALACDPGPIRIPLRGDVVDLVIAIDTSGSMIPHIPLVNAWLVRKLEPALRKAGIDYQLQVVADLDDLSWMGNPSRKGAWVPSDAGVHVDALVRSNDVLGVLLSTAKQTSGSWLSRLRPDSAVHLVIVTDDDPEAALAATFVQKLTQLAQKRLGSSAAPAFQLHSLLGIALNGPWVLRPDADPQSRGCAVAAGLPYQELSIRTNGLRGSVCFAESFNAFTDELLLRTRSGQPCQMMFPENFPADRLTSIRAISPSGRSDRHLQRAFDADNCHFATPRYLVTRNRLSVCPVTCGALTADGFTEIEAVANCP